MINEDATMFRSQGYKSDDLCKRCAHVYKHSHFDLMND